MSTRSETFGRLLKGAINSIAAYEGKIAPAVEEELGAQIGLAGSALQRYKAGNLPPEPRTIEILATAAVRRGYLGRAWLQVFLQAARYPVPEQLIAQLVPGTPTPPVSTAAVLPGGMLAFLFTDIAGSTQLWEQQPQAMQRALARHDTILRQAIAQQRGTIFKTVGDAFCAAFASMPDALGAAIGAQRALQIEAWDARGLLPGTAIRVRMALHAGTAEVRDSDYFGPPLNRTARLCTAGAGGQILLSRAAYELARDFLPPDADLRDLGEHRLRDLARPEQIFQVVGPGLSSVFPPLTTLHAARTNLPVQATALIGREREVEAIGDLLCQDDLRLLTLTGPGGVGKTRLALQAASELLDYFADGVWFVGLAPISDPALLPSVILQSLGVQELQNQTPQEQLVAYLHRKELLLLLDNFEQIVDAAPVVAEILAATTGIKLLVTSRATLHIYGEREYAVPPLILPERAPLPSLDHLTQSEAVRLFIDRARAVKADFTITNQTAPAVAEICYRLDGLPLAIELAAARSKILSPQAILARLDSRLTLLAGGARNLPARQQTLRGAIDWSYHLLGVEEQALFERLAIFVGGCTLSSAEAVLADDSAESGQTSVSLPRAMILEWLAALVDKSLVQQTTQPDGDTRFRMLETIREYAQERLLDSEMAIPLQQRFTRFMIGLATWPAGKPSLDEQRIWADRVSAERENWRAALGWALDGGDLTLGTQLAVAVCIFSQGRGGWSEARLWAERAVALSAPLPLELRTAAIQAAGNLALGAGDLARAMALNDTLLEQFHEPADQPARAWGLLDRSHIAWLRSAYDEAQSAAEQAHTLCESLSDRVGLATARRALADIALEQGADAHASALYAQTSATLQDYPHVNAFVLLLQGDLALRRGDTGAATGWYAAAQKPFEAVGLPDGLAWVQRSRGLLALTEGDSARAAALLEASVETFRSIGDMIGLAWSLHHLAVAVYRNGNQQRSAALFREGVMLQCQQGHRLRLAESAAYAAAWKGEAGAYEQGVQLVGASAGLRAACASSAPEAQRVAADALLATLSQSLELGVAAAAYAAGQHWSVAQVAQACQVC